MAYYFMIEEKKGKHIPLEIKKSIYFQITKSQYNKPFAYSLNEIDSFTMMFNNEQELRNALISEGILPIELHYKQLSIRFLTKGQYEKVRYDFLYQKDIEYIIEPLKVVEFIMQKYYQNDFVFLQKFANNFSKYRECSTTAPEVAQSSAASIREGKRNYLLESIDKNGDLLVARLVKLLILKHTEETDGTIKYKDEINYRNLHSVIAFINNYYKVDTKEQQMILKGFELPKQTLTVPIVKTKSKKKKNTPLEGQISFLI